ncbi:Riboflavin kinase/FAD synthetase [Candidatus Magnetobacterium bavaricum]|uniref:Riboflavin biosynthesis protein n=1 Tax=Candidatus Magnetobacterium bavaricum TaxID=29290 RepID=A0A0F3GQ91_9BACT|nr:Riboflavin kinase/FAD synthetase [Candidatus Magnetobacterium bavaricum]
MEIVKGLENIAGQYKGPVVTVGNFDGVHMGHQKIFSEVVRHARDIDGTAIVMTFDPHPAVFTNPQLQMKFLTPFEIKTELIENSAVDVLICIAFNKEFASLAPEQFIREVLVQRIGVTHVIVGHGFRFGRGKQGTTDNFRRLSKRFGFGFNVVRNVRRGGLVVSSSRIRELLLKGDIDQTNSLLYRPYFIDGIVVKGKGRGGKCLGIPTANLCCADEFLPCGGVYAVRARADDDLFEGVANVGLNPTFGDNELSCEVHIFDYNGDLVGNTLRTYFIKRLRDEMTFASVDALKAQINKDIAQARGLLKRHNKV